MRATEKTNGEKLRELALHSATMEEFQIKAISEVMLKMTILEFEAEMEYMRSGDLQDYYEKIKKGDGK